MKRVRVLFNYKHGVGLEIPLSNWFTFRVLPTIGPPDYIEEATADTTEDLLSYHTLVI